MKENNEKPWEKGRSSHMEKRSLVWEGTVVVNVCLRPKKK